MAAPNLVSSNGAERADDLPLSVDQRKHLLASTLEKKVEQGYQIESQTDTSATVLIKGHRRWFGMIAGGADTRQTLSIDDQGHITTRPAQSPS
jgi:hypothetical protein